MDLSKTPSLPSGRKQAFQTLYTQRCFGEYETISGKGSTLMSTRSLRRSLQLLMETGLFKTLLDVGCGDFFWLSHMDLSSISYTGIDLIPELVESNRRHETSNIRFRLQDIVETTPTAYDMVLARDLFTHFPTHDIVEAFNHIKRSGSRFLATSGYNAEGVKPQQKDYYQNYTNTEIPPGEWRPIDLQKPPYNFRPPLFSIPDTDPGKYLHVWELDDLPYLGTHTILGETANPTTAADFGELRFFQQLCLLPYIQKITLFGSRARLTHRPDSDIDIMIHCDEDMTNQEWLDIVNLIDNADTPLPIECYHYHPTVDASLQNTWHHHTTVLYQR